MDAASQLQDALDQAVQTFAQNIGQLQLDAPPVPLGTEPISTTSPEDAQAAQEKTKAHISRTTDTLFQSFQHIAALISSLPGVDHTEEQQLELLKALDEDSRVAAEELEQAVKEAEALNRALSGNDNLGSAFSAERLE
ncbi:hypothetical protein HDU85_000391 [Gaertneriomyces sp. JEL0708]|nr:hypothetical protein HDU85_000391 [Gaertneriomyces sp. JEL0708]